MIQVLKTHPEPSALNVVAPTTAEDISDTIYGHHSVKDQLKLDQYGKCAYCERFFNGDYGAVEHYRPKKKYKIADGQPEHDGYVWLAYDWDNLLYSCSECNTSCKRTLFPLFDEAKRDIANKNIQFEEPLIINPTTENPFDFIGWRKEFACAIGHTPYAKAKGETTINILQLNTRGDLLKKRGSTFKEFCKLKVIVSFLVYIKAPADIVAIAKSLLLNKYSNNAEFAGMLNNQIL